MKPRWLDAGRRGKKQLIASGSGRATVARDSCEAPDNPWKSSFTSLLRVIVGMCQKRCVT